jgi:hypothetical protein|eukprot:CAMPEP_0169168200 /NCGR_PEP_ID=MMETSP1015-20121227/60875_1 /TAXON_ID=342587 /ORGANISM="Karlodinium micrum, Strain CCMP2283" /LENGTH=174 /DNA_ID=CAMNT_0009240955 /DNA_START=76 /DNA_END=600 /DNA_ORIENTATION=-
MNANESNVPWFQSLYEDVVKCTGRLEHHYRDDYQDRVLQNPQGIARPNARVWGNPEAQTNYHQTALEVFAASSLPQDFYRRMAELAVNDPEIARRLVDDRTSPLIWGKPHSLSFLFLQMCIRDKWHLCVDVWDKLGVHQRRKFLEVYKRGPPSKNFFLNIMVVAKELMGDETSV